MAPNTQSGDAHVARQRGMRKGTRSCLACRGRKIRCTYPKGSAICDACIAHSRECTEQTVQDIKNGGLDKRIGLKQRVRELETLVQRLVESGGAEAKSIETHARTLHADGPTMLSPPHSVGNGGNDTTSPSGISTEPSVDDDEDDSSDAYDSLDEVDVGVAASGFQKAPLLALFDNNLFLRDDPKESPPPADPTSSGLFSVSRHEAACKARQQRLARELRALILPWPIFQTMLEQGQGLTDLWKILLSEQNFLGIDDLSEGVRQLAQSEQPAQVLKALTLLAVILQQTADQAGDPRPLDLNARSRSQLFSKYVDTVESHLCNGNGLIGSLEGLESAVILCRIFFNAGRPRKAWLMYERSLAFARLLGLHRAAAWKTEPEPLIGRRREQLWWHLFIGNRMVSLLLGLPYSVLDAHIGIDPSGFSSSISDELAGSMSSFYSFYLRLGVITGRIIDRNHDTTSSPTAVYAETMKIDAALQTLEGNIPKTWKLLCEEGGDLTEFMKMGLKDIFQASNAQIWYHESRISLHMPYMMRNNHYSQEEGKYEYSRGVTIRSARSLIRSHLRLRTRTELANVVCQVADFQVFLAAVLLILDLLSRSKAAGPSNSRKRDADSYDDEQLIRDAYMMLDRLAKANTQKTNIPAQGVRVLDTLGHLIHGLPVPGMGGQNHRIVIPYFGAITIKASSALVQHRKEIESDLLSCKGKGASPISNPAQAGMGTTPSSSDATADGAAPPPAAAAAATGASGVASAGLTANGINSVEFTQPGTQANDLIFDGFGAPGFQNLQSVPMDPTAQVPFQVDYNSMNMPGLVPTTSSTMDIDGPLWNDAMWQNMLTQDLSLDLDVDWGSFPLGTST